MVGLYAVTNHKLLQKIQGRHPEGIYTSEDFLSKIKARDKFFTLSAGEGGIGWVHGPFVFLKTKESDLELENGKKSLLCEIEHKGDHFLNDYFWGAKACFKEKKHAESYREDLLRKERKLYGVI